MRVGGQLHVPAALSREIDPVPIVQEAGWAPGQVWAGAENLAPTGIFFFDPFCTFKSALLHVTYVSY
jgi:hypothetical protein